MTKEIPSELEQPSTCEYSSCTVSSQLEVYLGDTDWRAAWLCPEHFEIWKRSTEQRREQDRQHNEEETR